MSKLHIDLESRSAVDLRKTGVHVYAADPSTSLWCAAFAVGDGPIKLWLPGDPCPEEITAAVERRWPIVAHNFAFERTMWRHILTPRHGWPEPKLQQWSCTMSQALAMGLPASLENAAAAVGLEARKDMNGHSTMLRMSKPRRPRKGELPNDLHWFEDDDRKQTLFEYCKNDVAVERDLEKRLLPLRPQEQKIFWLDALINDRGVHVDVPLCNAALQVVEQAATWLDKEMVDVTRGAVGACSNVSQILEWLRDNGCPDVDSIAKGAIDDLLARRDLSPPVRRVLELRREAAKASVAKIAALLNGKSDDNRARGLLQFHAASTGRWGGRRFQPQNIKRPGLDDIDGVISAVRTGCAETVQLLFGEPLAAVGDTLRGMISAAPGNKIVAADFSNIEGRVVAWYGDERWKIDAFRRYDAGVGPDIYLVTAASIYGVPVESLNKHSPERSPGKVCELAFGFEGGVGAWRKFEAAAPNMPAFPDERVQDFKNAWREKHPGVTRCWAELPVAAISAVNNPGRVFKACGGRIAFRMAGSFCWMRLPSGRAICYPYPRIEDVRTPWGAMKPTFSYMGVDSYTRKWVRCYAHGGVLFNNVVQGTARDIEAEAMVRVERAGYPIILTVHDEVVAEPRADFGGAEEFQRLMSVLPPWADGLPIAASGFEASRYRK